MFNKKDNALVAFADPMQAQIGKYYTRTSFLVHWQHAGSGFMQASIVLHSGLVLSSSCGIVYRQRLIECKLHILHICTLIGV